MRTPSIGEFKTWARENERLALAVCLAQAFAECERERVDAYVRTIFARYRFTVDMCAPGKQPSREPITDPAELYLSTDEAHCTAYYAECDAAHRAHGFTGPDGHCPALVAANLHLEAQNALIDSGCELFDIERSGLYGENRAKMIELLLGACLSRERVAA